MAEIKKIIGIGKQIKNIQKVSEKKSFQAQNGTF